MNPNRSSSMPRERLLARVLSAGGWLAAGLLALVGCQKSGPVEARLPRVTTLGTCIEKYPAPSGCVWARSMDAIVWGTLTKVRAVELPALDMYSLNGDRIWVDTCDGAINIALELEVSVERALVGDVGGKVQVRIGLDQVSPLDPLPEVSRGELIWTRHGVPVSDGLLEGQKIGLPIHWMAADELWSLMGEIMFSVRAAEDGQEVIFFQIVHGDCRPRVPEDVPGMTLDEFADMLAACPADSDREAQARKEEMVVVWGTRPECYMAPVCIPRQARCDSDGDCSMEGGVCIDGLCHLP